MVQLEFGVWVYWLSYHQAHLGLPPLLGRLSRGNRSKLGLASNRLFSRRPLQLIRGARLAFTEAALSLFDSWRGACFREQ
jgi:hypothetical protein